MAERHYMIQWREKRKVTLDVMAKATNVSRYTLENIEQDDTYVTAPPIAQKIADAYKLSKKQYYSMIPENYRPGPNYDPDRYVQEQASFGDFVFGTDGGLAEGLRRDREKRRRWH